MYELAPAGFSETAPALLRIAKANWPEHFNAIEPGSDANYYADILHMLLRQPELVAHGTEVSGDLWAFSQAFHSMRKALADGKIGAYYLDEDAKAQPIRHYRHWATDAGLDDLLLGQFFDLWRVKDRQIIVRDDTVSLFFPAAGSKASAKGRDTFATRLRSIMEAAPDDPRPKGEVLRELSAEFQGLSGRQQEEAWADVAREFPAWSKPGRRKRVRSDEPA